jgi:hypothetical protein
VKVHKDWKIIEQLTNTMLSFSLSEMNFAYDQDSSVVPFSKAKYYLQKIEFTKRKKLRHMENN